MSRSVHAEQGESSPYNHYLHQFLPFSNESEGSRALRLSTADAC